MTNTISIQVGQTLEALHYAGAFNPLVGDATIVSIIQDSGNERAYSITGLAVGTTQIRLRLLDDSRVDIYQIDVVE